MLNNLNTETVADMGLKEVVQLLDLQDPEVENLVFRVTLNETATVMHMGDADPNDEHFIFHDNYWRKRLSHLNFPPYWFYFSAEGRDILATMINAEQHIGIHVPVNIPQQLKNKNYPYFSEVAEEKKLVINK